MDISLAVFLKFILNGLLAGSLYAVLASGLALVFGVMRFVNLAHGEIALLGGYSFYTFYTLLSWPLVPSLIGSLLVITVFIVLIEHGIFRKLRQSSPFIPLIASIALGMFLKNLLVLLFDQRARSLTDNATSYPIFADIVRITDVQIVLLATSIVLMFGLIFFLKRTRTGKAIRAVADNREVAAILGIPINKINMITFVLASCLAAVAGILIGFDQNLHPQLGTFFTIKSFAAVILGGIGSIRGAILGSYFIGLAENLLIAIPFGSFYIPSSYKDAIAFAALVLFLYIKPTGFFGARQSEKRA